MSKNIIMKEYTGSGYQEVYPKTDISLVVDGASKTYVDSNYGWEFIKESSQSVNDRSTYTQFYAEQLDADQFKDFFEIKLIITIKKGFSINAQAYSGNNETVDINDDLGGRSLATIPISLGIVNTFPNDLAIQCRFKRTGQTFSSIAGRVTGVSFEGPVAGSYLRMGSYQRFEIRSFNSSKQFTFTGTVNVSFFGKR